MKIYMCIFTVLILNNFIYIYFRIPRVYDAKNPDFIDFKMKNKNNT